MATITIRICKDGTKRYRVLIRKKKYPRMCKTFADLKTAKKWAAIHDPL